MEERLMRRAIELAKKGRGFVNPNPLVGALVVREGNVIGEGYHEYYGGPHAEVNAIKNAGKCDGASIYVTLEPCNHYGKTPPCVELIIKSGIKKVVIGMLDPNPLMAGKSVDILRAEGIEVVCGILKDEIADMNKVFIKYISEKKPYVVMKTAMTADGKIATKAGKSKWISGSLSRERVHDLRHEMMAIMVGIGTVLADNPSLNVRGEKDSKIVPVIVDSKGRIPLKSKVLKVNDQVVIATTDSIDLEKEIELKSLGVTIIKCQDVNGRVDLNHLMTCLGDMGIDSLLLEGGGTLNWSAMKAQIVDEVVSFVGPKIFGRGISPVDGQGVESVEDAFQLSLLDIEKLGEDCLIRWKVKRCSQES